MKAKRYLCQFGILFSLLILMSGCEFAKTNTSPITRAGVWRASTAFGQMSLTVNDKGISITDVYVQFNNCDGTTAFAFLGGGPWDIDENGNFTVVSTNATFAANTIKGTFQGVAKKVSGTWEIGDCSGQWEAIQSASATPSIKTAVPSTPVATKPIASATAIPLDNACTIVNTADFTEVNSLYALPTKVQSFFTYRIADKGQPFNATDVISDPSLPGARFVTAGISSNYVLVAIERGGIAHYAEASLFSLTSEDVTLLKAWHLSKIPTGLHGLKMIVCNP
jgi:hypothetical protein